MVTMPTHLKCSMNKALIFFAHRWCESNQVKYVTYLTWNTYLIIDHFRLTKYIGYRLSSKTTYFISHGKSTFYGELKSVSHHTILGTSGPDVVRAANIFYAMVFVIVVNLKFSLTSKNYAGLYCNNLWRNLLL